MWRPRRDVDPIADYQSSVHDVLEAFQEDDVLERRFSLPEISTSVTFSGRVAIGFHLIDYVAHSWDVARASGQIYTPADDLLQAAQSIAERVPNGPERLQPGAAFGPGTVLADDAPPFDRLLAFLGRSPDWPDSTQLRASSAGLTSLQKMSIVRLASSRVMSPVGICRTM